MKNIFAERQQIRLWIFGLLTPFSLENVYQLTNLFLSKIICLVWLGAFPNTYNTSSLQWAFQVSCFSRPVLNLFNTNGIESYGVVVWKYLWQKAAEIKVWTRNPTWTNCKIALASDPMSYLSTYAQSCLLTSTISLILTSSLALIIVMKPLLVLDQHKACCTWRCVREIYTTAHSTIRYNSRLSDGCNIHPVPFSNQDKPYRNQDKPTNQTNKNQIFPIIYFPQGQ